MDLNLVHTNFLVDYPRLTAPNTKYVGGMHIRDGEDHYQLSRLELQTIHHFSQKWIRPLLRPSLSTKRFHI